jgi:hypothetical protein
MPGLLALSIFLLGRPGPGAGPGESSSPWCIGFAVAGLVPRCVALAGKPTLGRLAAAPAVGALWAR